jgi:hypothetical protein
MSLHFSQSLKPTIPFPVSFFHFSLFLPSAHGFLLWLRWWCSTGDILAFSSFPSCWWWLCSPKSSYQCLENSKLHPRIGFMVTGNSFFSLTAFLLLLVTQVLFSPTLLNTLFFSMTATLFAFVLSFFSWYFLAEDHCQCSCLFFNTDGLAQIWDCMDEMRECSSNYWLFFHIAKYFQTRTYILDLSRSCILALS